MTPRLHRAVVKAAADSIETKAAVTEARMPMMYPRFVCRVCLVPCHNAHTLTAAMSCPAITLEYVPKNVLLPVTETEFQRCRSAVRTVAATRDSRTRKGHNRATSCSRTANPRSEP